MQKVAIIKLGAKGDVIRTLSLLEPLRKKHPEAEINWITKKDVSDLLENHPLINKVYTLPYQGPTEFDYVYNFDIEKEATDLAEKIKASKKFGFGSDSGFPVALNLGAEYYLNTIFDDELKKSNKKTYQEMMSEAAELDYEKSAPKIYLTEDDKGYAERFLSENNLTNKKIIGIHMGASPRWPSKAWHVSEVKDFIKLAKSQGFQVLLFGGPDEIEFHKKLSKELEEQEVIIYHNDPKNTNREFAALVSVCDAMICADSFALHISMALEKQTIGLFFCTSPEEVESYGLLTKVVSPMLPNFFPEKMDQYSEDLVKSIPAEEVIIKIRGVTSI